MLRIRRGKIRILIDDGSGKPRACWADPTVIGGSSGRAPSPSVPGQVLASA